MRLLNILIGIVHSRASADLAQIVAGYLSQCVKVGAINVDLGIQIPTRDELRHYIGRKLNTEVDIYGSDLDALGKISRDVLTQVRGIPGMDNADTNVQEATPELQFQVDRQKALDLGVSFSDIANTINSATNGTLSSYYQEGGFQYPIYVQVPENSRKEIDQVLGLPVAPGAAPATGTATGDASGM